ncbi:MAG: metalloregulator ArsR/SmtB family transcription factor [Thermoanaerobaculia bacterium]|nr:metalloregulator ArsR/SmtB family transcription factor [Thermoanaerobaculia bacterium]
MKRTPDYSSLAELLALGSNPHRLRMLHDLALGKQTVRELAEPLGITTTAVSAHLQLFTRLGLVTAQRRHNHHVYRLERRHPNTVRLARALPELFPL